MMILSVIFVLSAGVSDAQPKEKYKDIFMKSDKVEYDADNDILIARGNNYIEFQNYKIRSDYIYYDIANDELFAEGNLHITENDDRVIIGQRAFFADTLKSGIITEFIMQSGYSHLMSRTAHIIDRNNIYLTRSAFTACDISCGKTPIWEIDAGDAYLDSENHNIAYKNVFFKVYNVPVIYVPYFSHPTPNAPAKSGLLRPHLKNGSVVIPLYFRIKDNMDITISPRINNSFTIFDLEARHKVKYGSYIARGSFGKVPYKTTDHGVVLKDSTPMRYHLFSKGVFNYQGYNLGFDINIASDKAYLKNYHEIFNSYLTSEIYVNKIQGRDYLHMEAMHFQGLRKEDQNITDPWILPGIRDKRTYTIMDDDSFTFVFDKTLVLYNESSTTQILRTAFDLSLNKYLQLDNGHLFTIGAHDRANFYYFDLSDTYIIASRNRSLGNGFWTYSNQKSASIFRHIPELSLRWAYPLLSRVSSKMNVNLEPVVTFNVGTPFKARHHKFGLIDTPKYDLDETNIFERNRISGLDYHEHGRRLSYGVNSSLSSDILYLYGFLGHSVDKKNIQMNVPSNGYVGSVGGEILNSYVAHYKFRQDNKFNNIIDETMIGYNKPSFNLSMRLVRIKNISKYFSENNLALERNQVKNLRFGSGLELIPNLRLNMDSVIDVTKNNKWQKLTQGIGVTYLKDCVSIDLRVWQNFMQDNSRGVRKTTSYSFNLGMKVLNM